METKERIMSDAVKLMAIGCLTVALCVSVALVPGNTFLIKTLAIGLCAVAGVPAVAGGIKLLRDRQ